MSDYLMIGEVLKPQGIRGECKIRSWAAEPANVTGWTQLYRCRETDFTPVVFRLHRIQDNYVYGVLGNCSTPEEAEIYRGQKLYIDRKHAAPLEKGAHYIADLIGCEAIDEAGNRLGKLQEVLQYGSVDTWVFQGARGTWMAPALKDVFPEVDPASRLISVFSPRLEEVAVFED